jgi:hypothetical protein
MSEACHVRRTQPEDIPKLIALQKRVYPEIPPWTRVKLEKQLEVFPQGQLTAECDGEVVGCASSLIVAWDDWAETHTWREITAAGTFHNHNPDGRFRRDATDVAPDKLVEHDIADDEDAGAAGGGEEFRYPGCSQTLRAHLKDGLGAGEE